MKRIVLNVLILLGNIFFPVSVFAQSGANRPPSEWMSEIQVPGIPNGGIDLIGSTIVPNFINIILFTVFLCSLIMLIVGGVMWIMSGGDKEGMAKAKGTVTYAIIGMVLGVSSFLILNTIGGIFGINLLDSLSFIPRGVFPN